MFYRQVTEKKTELIKREDVAVANDQRLVSIEREIARIKGKITRIEIVLKDWNLRLNLIP